MEFEKFSYGYSYNETQFFSVPKMTRSLALLAGFLFFAQSAYAADPYTVFNAAPFSSVKNARADGSYVGYTGDGGYIEYKNLNFTEGASKLIAEVAIDKAYAGRTFKVRLGAATGTVVGQLAVADTGGWGAFNKRSLSVNIPKGQHNVFITFDRGGVANFKGFQFTRAELSQEPELAPTPIPAPTPAPATPIVSVESTSVQLKVSEASGSQGLSLSGGYTSQTRPGSYVRFDNVNLGGGANRAQIEIAVDPNYANGKIEIRSGSPTGQLAGTFNAPSTGGWFKFQTQSFPVSLVKGNQNIYLVFQSWGVGTLKSLTLIGEKQISTPAPTPIPPVAQPAPVSPVVTPPTPAPTPSVVAQIDGYTEFEAEKFSVSSGVRADGNLVGYITPKSYVGYKGVSLSSGAKTLTAKLAAPPEAANQTFDIRLGSPTGALISKGTVLSTGGWGNVQAQTFETNIAAGTHDIYFVFNGWGVGNFDKFQFSQNSPVREPTSVPPVVKEPTPTTSPVVAKPPAAAGSCTAYALRTAPGSVKTTMVRPGSPIKVPEHFMGLHYHTDTETWKYGYSKPVPKPTYDYGYVRTLSAAVGGLAERGFWSNIEVAPGVYDFSYMDRWMAQSGDRPVIWLIYGTPSFYQKYPGEPSRWPSWKGVASPPTDAGHAALKRFAQKVKAKYGSRIAAFEVWNEPTLPWTGGVNSFNDRWSPEWGRANGQYYGPFFSGSASDLANIAFTLNTAGLGVPILGAAFVDSWFAGATTVNRFLNAPVTLPGGWGQGKSHIQGLSKHYYDYSYNPTDLIKHIDGYRQKLVEAGVGHLPIWGTETGAEVTGLFKAYDYRAPTNIQRWVLIGAAKGLESLVLYGHFDPIDATGYLGDPVNNQAVITTLRESAQIMGQTICHAAVLSDNRVWVLTSTGQTFLK